MTHAYEVNRLFPNHILFFMSVCGFKIDKSLKTKQKQNLK